jgi:hypothetical protein
LKRGQRLRELLLTGGVCLTKEEPMRQKALFSCLFGLLCAVFAATPVPALERGAYSVEVLVNGRPLREHAARGTTYVEALREAEYSVRLQNRTGRRVAVALSVDGLNSIDAKRTSAREAAKWILGPYQTIVLDGWQTSSATARHFFFTTEDRSYGAWLGETDNLGIVSAAFFHEKGPRPVPYVKERKREGAADAPAPGESSRQAPEAGAQTPELSDDLAATGIGREVDHRVVRVSFNAEKKPAAVLQIRYEYRDALVRLGVLPSIEEPLARRERARGFEDTGYAPDPYRGCD